MKKFTVFADDIHPSAVKRLEEVATVFTQFHQIPNLADVDAVILRGHVIDRAEMLRMPRLKVISRHGVGMDTVDVAAAKELGIPIVYTPYANQNAVVELSIALILAALRYPAHFLRTDTHPHPLGYELYGKTVGIIGVGRIGKILSSKLHTAFSVELLGYHPRMDQTALAQHHIRKINTLEELASLSDVLCLTLPLTSETRHMIDGRIIGCMKPHSVLINVSRGGIVDEDALYVALRKKQIFAAACDVMLNEPVPPTHPLLSLENFIGLPHVGANTQQAMYAMAMTAAEDVIAILNGKAPRFPYY